MMEHRIVKLGEDKYQLQGRKIRRFGRISPWASYAHGAAKTKVEIPATFFSLEALMSSARSHLTAGEVIPVMDAVAA